MDSPTRRLSTRRGSVSASDPYGAHSEVNYSPNRSISSKLTIVRVNDSQLNHDSDPSQQSHRPSSPVSFQSRRHKRHGSTSSVGSNGSESGRLSFAFTTFGPANPSSRSTSPSASRHQRPGSPSNSPMARHRGGSFSKPKLAPEQLLELARSSTNPKSTPLPTSQSPFPAATSSPNFTPLPDNVYLPFIDRPSEVSTLISTAPTAKLFALLSQTFPHEYRQSHNTVTSPDFIDRDPKLWSFDQLEYWFKSIDRNTAVDEQWVRKSRACILSHSELIWERIKGALGVPPELDMSEDEVDEFTQNTEEDVLLSSLSRLNEPANEDSPALDDPNHSPITYTPPEDVLPSSQAISIEPVFAADPNVSSPHDPASGLGDITEEDSEANDETESPSPNSPRLDDRIQGLRIWNSPSPPHSHAFANPIPLSAISPLPSPPASSSGVKETTISEGASLTRRNSSSSSVFLDSPLTSSTSYFAYSDAGDDPYHLGAERGPGHPLFPSSFAHLAVGPTLRANNPALRRPSHPPPSAFSKGKRGLQSWVGNTWDGRSSDYAVTVASGSSIVGEV